MRKAISLLTLAFIAASCGGGGSNTTSEYSQDSRGKLIVSVKFSEQVKRHISSDTDFIKLNLQSDFFSLETGSFVSNPLDEVVLTPANSTAVIDVPSGYVDGLISLWDNDTGAGVPYPIGGVWIHTSVKPDETKTLDVFVPSGIWNLSSPLKGITRMQVTAFPTHESFGWGNTIPSYVTFDSDWYSQLSSQGKSSATGVPPLGGIVEQVIAEKEDGTLLMGNFATVPPFSFIDESKATGEFGIFMLNQEEGTKSIPIRGKFDTSNPSQVTLYWFDDISCEVNATLSNGTVVSFPLGFECEGFLPAEAFNGTGSFNGTYEFDNVTACLSKFSEESYFFVPSKECEYYAGNGTSVENNSYYDKYQIEGSGNEYFWVKDVHISYSITNLESTTATISDLPLPWKNMAKIASFNATCAEEDNCTYEWQISNPDGHEISCFIEMEDGNKYDVNCTDGNFTCSGSNNCTNVQPVKLVVRDKAFVQPLADVKYAEYFAEEWNTPTENATGNATENTNETGEMNATETLPAGTNVTVDSVESFLSNANGKHVTIFDDEVVICLLTLSNDTSNGTSFTITNCTDSSYDGNGTVLEADGTVIIKDDDGEVNKVVYVDNNTLLGNYEEDGGDYFTASFVISPANETSNDTVLTSYIAGSWKYYKYDDETNTWEKMDECVTFYDNGTFTWFGSNGTETGNYTIQNGQIVVPGDSTNRTIINIIDNDTFIMSEIRYTDDGSGSVEDYDNRIWIRVDSCQ